MILIADAGGTKTEWRLITDSRVKQFRSAGFNPKTKAPEILINSLPIEILNAHPQKVYYYGAGITSEQDEQHISDILKKTMSKSTIEVCSDTLGAARALYENEPGWVGILGTGSGAAYYDGNEITRRVPSLGLQLGDEGGGSSLGKALLVKYLRRQLPDGLMHMIQVQYPEIREEEVLNRIYHQHQGSELFNRLVPFMVEHQSMPEVYRLIENEFNRYFDAYFSGLTEVSMRFSGSVAHFLSNILRSVSQSKGFKVSLIMQSPIAGLALYHQKHG